MPGTGALAERMEPMPERVRRSPMNRSRLQSTILSAATLAVSGRAQAGVPAASTSTVDPVIVACPAGDVVFTVVARHIDNVPWAEGDVWLSFCGCPGFHLETRTSPYLIESDGCTASEFPAADGTSLFPIAAGGTCASPVTVLAEGVWLGVRPVASLDQDGDHVVSNADLALIQSKVGSHDVTADFDGDGTVTSSDLAFAQSHLGHGAATGVPFGPTASGGLRFSRPPSPNPARGSVTFAVSTPTMRRVDVIVADLGGRRVASLWSGPLAAGDHAFTWRGQTDHGSVPRSGLYMVQIRSGDVAVAKLFALLRCA